MTSTTLVVLSGGMDSTTLAYRVARQGPLACVSFDYGQRHRKELEYAALTADKLGAPHTIVPMTWLAPMIAGSSSLVTPEVDVPDGHYAEDTMRATVVPNRNAIMLNLAAAIAIAEGYQSIATGVHAGDHFVYPDCRPEFIDSQQHTIALANAGFLPDNWHGIDAPFLFIGKHDIAQLGDEAGVPWEDTWSCYKGGDIHCGACGTCFERREAFTLAGINDPTPYAALPEYQAPTA